MNVLDDFVNDPVISDDGCCVHCGGEFGKHHDCPQVKARQKLAALRAQNAALIEALKAYVEHDDNEASYDYGEITTCNCKQCKRARAALAAAKGE